LQASVSGVKAAKDCANGVFLDPAYDPVLRQIVYRQDSLSEGLVPGKHYTISVFPPPGDGTTNGIQAFDGAPLEHAVSRTFTTRGVEPPDSLPDTPPAVDFCGDLFPHVLRDTCAANGCHTSTGADDHGVHLGAAEGLDFSSRARLAATSPHVAHETQIGEHAAQPEVSPSSFGRAMPIIDPTRPGNSYLLYKLLANARNGAKASTPALEQTRLDEIARLRATVVVGLPMPPEDGRGKELTQNELSGLSAWIAAGAPTACP
jgi:hypothetical protein